MSAWAGQPNQARDEIEFLTAAFESVVGKQCQAGR
jgi:hypothetical protein